MSWLTKLLPPKVKREQGAPRRASLPEGLWSKCSACEAVLYATDLASNLQVCPKCGHHNRLNSRQRLDLLLIFQYHQVIARDAHFFVFGDAQRFQQQSGRRSRFGLPGREIKR